MNVAISIFARRGHLLAAFAAAVLLAASSGTAWAQPSSIPVTLTMRLSSSVAESASRSASTPGRVPLTIGWSASKYDPNLSDDDNMRTASVFTTTGPHLTLTATCNGETFAGEPNAATNPCGFQIESKDGTALSGTATLGGDGTPITFPASGEGTDVETTIELFVSDLPDDGDWNNETVVLTLDLVDGSSVEITDSDGDSNDVPLRATPRKSTLTITDDDPAPKLTFAPPSIQLAKGNMQTMTVGVDIGGTSSAKAGIRGKLNGLDGVTDRDGSGDEILLSVSPPEAVGSLIKIWRDAEPDQRATDLVTDRQGRYIVGTIGRGTGNTGAGAVGTDDMATNNGIALNIKAIDVSGFRDEQITFTLMEGRTEAQKKGDGGGIDDADPATVTILSAEETPTVTFSTEAIDIDEGDSETVHLLADTDQGSEVGSATVRVSGDALISLSQGGSSISGGTVSFGGSANAELTITALMDRELEDGEEKTATVTITDASGASIGDPRALTVTVVGATAVPALPLIGQLLLALFLMAGGSRLYRRRQK